MKSCHPKMDSYWIRVLKKLLIIGNVESNPGPKKGPVTNFMNLEVEESTVSLNKESFLQAPINSLFSEIDKIYQQKCDLRQENSDLKSKLITKEEEITNLKYEIEKLKQKICKQASEEDYSREKELLIQKPIRDIFDQIGKLVKEKCDLQKTVEYRNEEIKNLKAEVNQLKDRTCAEENEDVCFFPVPVIPGLKVEVLKALKTDSWTQCKSILNEKLDKESVLYRQLQTVADKNLLFDVISKGYIELLQLLWRNGLNLVVKEKIHGYSLLHTATMNNEVAIVKFLLTVGMDVNIRDDDNRSPLHHAAYDGYLNCVKVLINHGADINATDCYDDTPLHDAVTKGHKSVIKYLIDNKCDISIVNNEGKTVLDIARDMKMHKLMEILAGISRGRTPVR